MLEVVNATELAAGVYPGWNRERCFQYTLVCKAAWRFDTEGNLSPLPHPPIVEVDEYRGEPGRSGLARAAEIAPFKKGCDVYLTGTAHPPREGLRVMEAGFVLETGGGGELRRTVRVFGRRTWERSMAGVTPSEPEPLEPTPLIPEYAFGGRGEGGDDEGYPMNPVGMGYNPTLRLKNPELPRIELGPSFIWQPGHKPVPAIVGPLPDLWEPRRSERGTAERDITDAGGLPLCPWGEDAEDSLHNCAPPEQRLPSPLQGGERLSLWGLFPGRPAGQPVTLCVPRVRIDAVLIEGGRPRPVDLSCDTLHIDADAQEIHVVYRAGIQRDFLEPRPGQFHVRAAIVAEEGTEGQAQVVEEMP